MHGRDDQAWQIWFQLPGQKASAPRSKTSVFGVVCTSQQPCRAEAGSCLIGFLLCRAWFAHSWYPGARGHILPLDPVHHDRHESGLCVVGGQPVRTSFTWNQKDVDMVATWFNVHVLEMYQWCRASWFSSCWKSQNPHKLAPLIRYICQDLSRSIQLRRCQLV